MKITRLMAIVLVAVMAVSCFAFNASAAEKTVTVIVGDAQIEYDEAKLALLADGNTASDATAFSNEGLVSFKNTGFNHDDGVDAAVEATFEIVLDLGEVQTIGSISLDAYNEPNSMVVLPSVSYYVSADGENYYQINAGGAVNPAADAAANAVTTLKADFITRTAVNARYVKAVVTFKNGWVFLSELSVGEANPDAAAIDDLGAGYAYTENATTSPGIGIFDSTYTGGNEEGTAGVIDCSINENGKNFLNSQLIKAVYDADADAYKIVYSKVNPWNSDPELNGHRFTETLAEGEILVAIVTGGTVADAFSGCKWIARGLVEGDWLVLNEGTVAFLPSYAIVPEQGGDEPSEPEQPSEPEVDTEKEEYAANLETLVGEATKDTSFDLVIDSVTDENGLVTVTVTVANIADGVELTGLYANLYYDTEKMTNITVVNEDNSLDCLTKLPSASWEAENLICNKENYIEIGIGVTTGDVVAISEETPLELTFKFQLKDGCDYAGVYVTSESLSGSDFKFVDYYGNGAAELVEIPVVDEPSDDETSAPTTGDAGIVVFAVLALVAVCGAAVVVKVRH